MAKFLQKAQCEPWTGRDAPGGLRAEARPLGKEGPRVRAGGPGQGQTCHLQRWPPWARGGAGPRGTCCQKRKKETKSEKGKRLHGVGTSLQAEVPRATLCQPSPRRSVPRVPRPVEASGPKGFSWEGSPEALAPGTTFRNLEHKRKTKKKAVREVAAGQGRAPVLQAEGTALGEGSRGPFQSRGCPRACLRQGTFTVFCPQSQVFPWGEGEPPCSPACLANKLGPETQKETSFPGEARMPKVRLSPRDPKTPPPHRVFDSETQNLG